MTEEKTQDYTDDNNEGDVDTREANFECEKKTDQKPHATGYQLKASIAG
jgi:hypothetical protein